MKAFMVLSAVLLLSTCVGERDRVDVPIMATIVDTRSGEIQRCEWKGYDIPPDCVPGETP